MPYFKLGFIFLDYVEQEVYLYILYYCLFSTLIIDIIKIITNLVNNLFLIAEFQLYEYKIAFTLFSGFDR